MYRMHSCCMYILFDKDHMRCYFLLQNICIICMYVCMRKLYRMVILFLPISPLITTASPKMGDTLKLSSSSPVAME